MGPKSDWLKSVLGRESGSLSVHTLELEIGYLLLNDPAGKAGVGGGVGGGCESCTSSAIGSHMAGPITLKLSGIDRGNSVSVLVRVRGGMI